MGSKRAQIRTPSEIRRWQKGPTNPHLCGSGLSSRSWSFPRPGGIAGDITVSAVSQLDLSHSQSGVGKHGSTESIKVGQGQGLRATLLTDKRD